MVIIVHNLQVVPIISDQWTKCTEKQRAFVLLRCWMLIVDLIIIHYIGIGYILG